MKIPRQAATGRPDECCTIWKEIYKTVCKVFCCDILLCVFFLIKKLWSFTKKTGSISAEMMTVSLKRFQISETELLNYLTFDKKVAKKALTTAYQPWVLLISFLFFFLKYFYYTR